MMGVCYLNGRQVYARNQSSSLSWNARSSGIRQNGEELLAEYLTLSSREGLRVGENVLAVHGLNARRTDRDFLFRFEADLWSQLTGLSAEPGFMGDPSPEAPKIRVYSGALEIPVIEQKSQVFHEPLSMTLTHPDKETSIYYPDPPRSRWRRE